MLTETTRSTPLTSAARASLMFPRLTSAQIARIASHGVIRPITRGEVLVEDGQTDVPFFVVTAGEIEIIRPSGLGDLLVAVDGSGQFTGEVSMLLGRRALMRVQVSESGEVIQLTRDQMHALIQTDAEVSEVLMKALIHRRIELVPSLANLGQFEGAGVYYSATFMEEAQLRDGDEVIVGGGANSAGQAAVFLAQTARRVHVLVRSNSLSESMSRYLLRRIEETPTIQLRTRTEIVALEGNGHLERVQWRDGTGAVTSHDVKHVFLMTGAEANTGWLNGRVALDAKGFIKTGPDLTKEDLAAAQWPPERSPYLLETSLPGVFAVGDVRCGNIKRVASAVGEGSIAISFVHRVLAE